MSTSPLDCPLRKISASPVFRRAIIKQIWGISLGPIAYDDQRGIYEAYFKHIYQQLCIAACTTGEEMSLWTHDSILKVSERLMLESLRTTTLETLTETSDPTTQIPESIAKLAASLLLPLNISGVGGARRGAVVDWSASESLESALHTVFSALKQRSLTSTCASCSAQVVFPRSFNARMLEHIAGFEIVWTSNLLDHLLMVDNDDKRYVYIFHQVNFLERVRHNRYDNLGKAEVNENCS